MGLAQNIARNILADEYRELVESGHQGQRNLDSLRERIAELELSLEDGGWTRLGGEGVEEVSREGWRAITHLGRRC